MSETCEQCSGCEKCWPMESVRPAPEWVDGYNKALEDAAALFKLDPHQSPYKKITRPVVQEMILAIRRKT